MVDLTALYITASELTEPWASYHLSHLRAALGDYPVVSVSRKPMDFGTNVVETNPKSYWNIYSQMLVAAKIATTPYVAMAEDDVLYSREHFHEFRPPDDKVSYNRARWSLFTWDPIYCLRQRISNCTLIAPRKLLIEALEERQAKHPAGASDKITGEIGRWKVAHWLDVKNYPCVEWWSTVAVVQLNHPQGSDDRQSRQWKKHGQLKAYDIPHWGPATKVVQYYGPCKTRDGQIPVSG